MGITFAIFNLFWNNALSKRLSLLYGLLVGLHSQLSFS